MQNTHGPTEAERAAVLGKFLLTSKESARMLSISQRKLWSLQASGEIPSVRIGRCLRFPLDELRLWVAKQIKSGSSR